MVETSRRKAKHLGADSELKLVWQKAEAALTDDWMFPLDFLHFIATVLLAIQHSKWANLIKMLGATRSAEMRQSPGQMHTVSYFLIHMIILILSLFCAIAVLLMFKERYCDRKQEKSCKFDSSSGFSVWRLRVLVSLVSSHIPETEPLNRSLDWRNKVSEWCVCAWWWSSRHVDRLQRPLWPWRRSKALQVIADRYWDLNIFVLVNVKEESTEI